MSKQPQRVLVVEREETLSLLLHERGIEVIRIEPGAVREKLSHVQCEAMVVLVPSEADRGKGTLSLIRDTARRLPLLMVGDVPERDAVRFIREGAQDVLPARGLTAIGLARALQRAIARYAAFEPLLESEQHYKRLLESITDYTYKVRIRGREVVDTVHHPNCAAITGYTAEQYRIDPRLWLRMVHRDDHAAVLEQAERVRRGESPPPLEHRIFHKNGAIRWVRNTVVPFQDRTGKLAGYDGLIRDITARKQAEEQLVKSEAFYHSLVETLPQHIIRKDVNERFTFANQKFCRLLGKPLAEIIGKSDFDFYPAELASKYQADDRHVIKTGKSLDIVEENRTPGGEIRYVNVIKVPIYDARDRIIGIQGIFWDITEKRRAEQQLKQANEELRKANEALKAAQRQLIQAAKMESIGTLAAGVAHEVKNPLATLTMGLNYLDKNAHSSDPNLSLVLHEMREAISRADRITRELLDFSAARHLDVRSESLNHVLEQTLVLLRHELNKQQIELVTDLAPSLPPVAIERNQIQQVFVNVFMNAIQAMSGGGTLKVTTFQERLTTGLHEEGSRTSQQIFAGDTVVIARIEDTGPGIAREHLEQIFDPFFTTKPTGVGTGLGLAVSKKIVELHGGAIEVSNRPAGGVQVAIILRAERHDEKEGVAGG